MRGRLRKTVLIHLLGVALTLVGIAPVLAGPAVPVRQSVPEASHCCASVSECCGIICCQPAAPQPTPAHQPTAAKARTADPLSAGPGGQLSTIPAGAISDRAYGASGPLAPLASLTLQAQQVRLQI